jgi:hypothetical protein
MLLGFSGKKRRGKDTAANYLVEQNNFNKHGFADKVKAMLLAINPIISVPNDKYVRLSALISEVGWEEAKEITEVRKLLQRLGTEGGRKLFGEDFWVNELFKDLKNTYDFYNTVDARGNRVEMIQSHITIPDARFDNEALAIRNRGGYVIKIESDREGLPEPDSHASEGEMNPMLIDFVVKNNGTIEELQQNIAVIVQELKAR